MKTRALITAFLSHVSVEESTRAAWTMSLERFAQFAKARPLRSPLFLEYRAQLTRDGLKESSIATYLVPVRRMVSWAVQMEYLPFNPMPQMRFTIGNPDKSPILPAELEAMVCEAQCVAGYDDWPLALRVAWHTGLRLSDVVLLQKSSLDTAEFAIRAMPRKTKKFLRMVEIPVPPELITAAVSHAEGNDVFPRLAQHYRRDKHKSLSAQFGYLAGKADVIGKGFHCFRHGFVTRSLNNGVRPELVADMTGINLSQIMSYFHAGLDEKRAALGLANRKEDVA